jgi:predicted RNase H-like nuclease (RuvC/YqgF family)
MIEKTRWQELKRKEKLLKKVLEIFRVEAKDLPRVVERFQREIKKMEEKLKNFNFVSSITI